MGEVGRLSVRLTEVAIVAVLLKIWIVSVDVPAGGMLAGEKDLLTSNCALAVAGKKKAASKQAAISRTTPKGDKFFLIQAGDYCMQQALGQQLNCKLFGLDTALKIPANPQDEGACKRCACLLQKFAGNDIIGNLLPLKSGEPGPTIESWISVKSGGVNGIVTS